MRSRRQSASTSLSVVGERNLRLTSVRIAVVLLLANPASRVAAQDASLAAGDRFEGKIATVADEDRVLFPVLAGAKVTVKATALPGQKVRPRIVLLDAGEPVPVPPGHSKIGKSGKRHKLKRVPVLTDSTYEAVITGLGGKLGRYELTVQEILPETEKQKLSLAPGTTDVVEFTGRVGTVVTIVVSAKKSGDALPWPVLRAPSGDSVDLTGLVLATSDGRRLEIGPVVLSETGCHEVLVAGSTTATEKVKVRVELTHAPLDGDLITEDPGHATLSGSLSLIDGAWLPGWGSSSESFEDGEVLLRLDPAADVAAIASELDVDVMAEAPNGWVRVRARSYVASPTVGSAGARPVAALLARARSLPGTLHAQPNHRRSSFAPPNDSLYGQQWDLPRCGFDTAWSLVTGDASRCVAVLDTGVRAEHPDLAGRLLPGYDFVAEAWNAGDGGGIDGDPRDEFLSMGTHGTHVIGTVAASFDNALGIAGAVPDVKVLPVRVLGVLGGTDFDIAQGILYAARLPNVSNKLPSIAADVINMSLGGPNPSEILHQAIRDAVAAGVVVVAASGNSGNTIPMYPATYPEVLAVGATDQQDAIAYYSSHGTHVDLAAPGGDKTKDLDQDGNQDGILSTIVDPQLGPTYGLKHGTSMAAPHVAAAAYLIRAAVPELPVPLVRATLAAGAVDLGAPGLDPFYGYGRLDVPASLEVALGTSSGPPEPFPHPDPLRFAAHQTDLPLALLNRGGGGPITVTNVTSDAFWVVPQTTSGTTPCLLDVHVENAAMAPGTYSANLTVETTAGTRTVPVTMEVDNDGPIPVGTVYVLAIDVVTGDIVRAVAVTEESADLFLLDPLPEGTYFIAAATDLDFDGVVGESHDYAGVASGASGSQGQIPAPDGSALSGVTIELLTGASAGLPGGGNLELPADL